MKTIFRVYESLLGDMEDSLSMGDFDVESDYIDNYNNDDNSLLRKFFNIKTFFGCENPFSLTQGSNGKTLNVDTGKGFSSIEMTPDNGGNMTVTDVISKLDCIEASNLKIKANNSNLTDKHLSKKLVSDYLEVKGVESISNVASLTKEKIFSSKLISICLKKLIFITFEYFTI